METRYKTPDGELTLVVEDDGGEFTLWFDGCRARVVGEAIRVFRGERKEASAVEAHLHDLFDDQVPIVLRTKGGRVVDAWIHEVPDEQPPLNDSPKGASYQLRSWSGAPIEL